MNATEQHICDSIDAHAAELTAFANDIYAHAELGYTEHRTAQRVADWLEQRCGLSPETGLAGTGVKAKLGTSRPSVCLIGELDGILCPEHPLAVPETGMSHACGHHMQLAALAGAALALCDPAVAQNLHGSAVFFAVPCEEHVPVNRLEQLRKQGIATCCGGKPELLLYGAFDDIDAAMTTHAHMVHCDKDFLLGSNSTSGFLSKLIRIKGRASHTAIAPEKGVNALDVVTLARSAIGMLRSTLRDEDCIRIGEIVRMGNSAINVVPHEVTVDLQVRAKTWDALLDADKKIDRAYRAAAYAFGADIEIIDDMGYLPTIPSLPCRALTDAAALLSNKASYEPVSFAVHNAASTDVGDLSHRMPVINFTFSGFSGTLHGADFRITDEEKAYLLPAKLAALTMYHLLKDNAVQARELIQQYQPKMSARQYHEYARKFDSGFVGEPSPFDR
ncbi:MAG: amidohydrolase [Clostridia bacterium]|nr:amidohydrolase [Clostridia bacterium]